MSMYLNVEKMGMKWSDAEQVYTKAGPKWKIYCVIPKELQNGFFKFWNKHKIKLKCSGYSVYKTPGFRWILSKWSADLEGLTGESEWDKKDPKEYDKSDLVPQKVKHIIGLRDWQVPSVGKLCASINKHGAAIDGSDMGTGKTYVGAAVARELGLKVAVICPLAVVTKWKTVINEHFGMKPEFVINYESLIRGNRKSIVEHKYIKVRSRDVKKYVWHLPKDTLIIFDECHKLKGMNTKTSKMAIHLIEQGYKVLYCSATVAVNPAELRAVGYGLGIHNNKNFYKWIQEHNCRKGRWGYYFKSHPMVLKKLHKDLFLDRGSRIRRDDIEGFPECDTQIEAYDLEEFDRQKIEQIYFDMRKELAKLERTCKREKDRTANALTIQLRARQKMELVKVPLFADMVEEYITNGMSVVVFLNFTDSIEALAKRLKTRCIIYGKNKRTTKIDERQGYIDDFLADKERVILVNAQAGGSGLDLNDKHGKYPRAALISPSYSAVVLRQVLGRIWREDSKTKSIQKILFVANTVEERVCKIVREKIANLDMINDGDLALPEDD